MTEQQQSESGHHKKNSPGENCLFSHSTELQHIHQVGKNVDKLLYHQDGDGGDGDEDDGNSTPHRNTKNSSAASVNQSLAIPCY